MKPKWLIAVLAAVSMPLLARAQMQMPQPAPELKKLDYFVGNWKMDSTMKSGPMGPGGDVAGTDKIEWMQGNFFLLIHSTFSSSMGNGIELAVIGYDSASKVYTYTSFNSVGEHESATGTFDGDTWTWNSSPGSNVKWRYTEKILSPTSYSIKFEMAPEGNTLATIMEGKATKQ